MQSDRSMDKMEPLIIGNLSASIPVIQGGMGVGVSLSRLAGAVAKEGGIGIISTAQIGYREMEFQKHPIETNLRVIGEEIRKAKELSDGGIIGVNIMVATREYEKYVMAALEAGADLIISGAGLPMTLPELAKGYPCKIAPIVSSMKSADVICKYWLKKYNRLPDLVVIEGPKAGGHLGFSNDYLDHIEEYDYDIEVKKIIEKVKFYANESKTQIPVVVAGGIYSREDMEHYLSLGANGVQIATRFVTTYECDAQEAFKQAYIDAKKEDIVIIKSPVGMPARAINNAFVKRTYEGKIPHGKCSLCVSTCNPLETPYCITQALISAVAGNTQDAILFCGSSAYRAEKMEHVHDIMNEFK